MRPGSNHPPALAVPRARMLPRGPGTDDAEAISVEFVTAIEKTVAEQISAVLTPIMEAQSRLERETATLKAMVKQGLAKEGGANGVAHNTVRMPTPWNHVPLSPLNCSRLSVRLPLARMWSESASSRELP